MGLFCPTPPVLFLTSPFPTALALAASWARHKDLFCPGIHLPSSPQTLTHTASLNLPTTQPSSQLHSPTHFSYNNPAPPQCSPCSVTPRWTSPLPALQCPPCTPIPAQLITTIPALPQTPTDPPLSQFPSYPHLFSSPLLLTPPSLPISSPCTASPQILSTPTSAVTPICPLHHPLTSSLSIPAHPPAHTPARPSPKRSPIDPSSASLYLPVLYTTPFTSFPLPGSPQTPNTAPLAPHPSVQCTPH